MGQSRIYYARSLRPLPKEVNGHRSLKCPTAASPGGRLRRYGPLCLLRLRCAHPRCRPPSAAIVNVAESPHTRYLANRQAMAEIDGKLRTLSARRSSLSQRLNSDTTIGCAGVMGFVVCWGAALIMFFHGTSSCSEGDIAAGVVLFVLSVLALALPVVVKWPSSQPPQARGRVPRRDRGRRPPDRTVEPASRPRPGRGGRFRGP